MLSVVLIIIAVLLAIVGIIGSVVPGLPGPPVSWIGLLVAFFAHRIDPVRNEITLTCLLVWLAVTVIVSILDYTVPARFTKMAGGTKAGSRGAVIGMIIGIFFTPIGMIPCALAGAFLGEFLQTGKNFGESLKSALGTFIGFMVGTGMKLVTSVWMAFVIIF